MSWLSKRAVGSFFLCAGLAVGALGCGSASGAEVEVVERLEGNEIVKDLVITWDGAAAGLYVTSPEARPPKGPNGNIEGGTTYWAIESNEFPDGFDAPITYGEIPGDEDIDDMTVANGGPKGGAPLEVGVTYKITIQGFGGDPTVQEITW
jgi:hypothetical protein